MTHQDKISLLITFVTGLVVGSYLYLTGFAPTYGLPEADKISAYDGFVIVGDSFGACEATRSCISFQLFQNGTYRVIYERSGGRVEKSSSIPRALQRELASALSQTALEAQSKPLLLPSCAFGEDATNFRFKVSYGATTYTLDTCATSIAYTEPLWTVLAKAWGSVVTIVK
jgi:hypothetical protein